MGTQTEEMSTERAEILGGQVRFDSIEFVESQESDLKPVDSECNVNHEGGSVSVMRDISPIPKTNPIV